MPIRVQNDLPVKEILEQENIFVMDEFRAAHQDIRPISIGLLNLMPLKEDTELQILRALSNTPLQVDVTFVRVTSHVSKNTSTSHIYKFIIVLVRFGMRDLTDLSLQELRWSRCHLKTWITGKN